MARTQARLATSSSASQTGRGHEDDRGPPHAIGARRAAAALARMLGRAIGIPGLAPRGVLRGVGARHPHAVVSGRGRRRVFLDGSGETAASQQAAGRRGSRLRRPRFHLRPRRRLLRLCAQGQRYCRSLCAAVRSLCASSDGINGLRNSIPTVER